jgi:hypothetical protein
VNNHGKKTRTTTQFQGFWGGAQGGKDRAQGEPEKGMRRNVYIPTLPCKY